MKTDVLFYKLFSDFPEIFFLLIGQPAEEARAYKMEALEVKQTAYRADGIFRPDVDHLDKPIYFAEVQFQDRERFYQRFFAKVFNYFNQNVDDREWQANLIFADRSLDPGMPVQYQKAFVNGLVERFYLEDLVGQEDLPAPLELIRLIVTPDREAEEAGRRTLRRVKEEIPAGPQRLEMVESAETILFYKFPQFSRKELERMFNLVDIEETAVYREAFSEGKTEGEKEGERRGKTEGEKKGRLDAVPLLLESGVSVERVAEALNLDVDEVRRLAAPASPAKGARRRRQVSRSPKNGSPAD